jgi:hypothetical protein
VTYERDSPARRCGERLAPNLPPTEAVYRKTDVFLWIGRRSPLIYIDTTVVEIFVDPVRKTWLNCVSMTSDKRGKLDEGVTEIFTLSVR